MYLFFSNGVICETTAVVTGSHEAGEILEWRTERGTCDGEEAAGTRGQTDKHTPVLKRKQALI